MWGLWLNILEGVTETGESKVGRASVLEVGIRLV